MEECSMMPCSPCKYWNTVSMRPCIEGRFIVVKQWKNVRCSNEVKEDSGLPRSGRCSMRPSGERRVRRAMYWKNVPWGVLRRKILRGQEVEECSMRPRCERTFNVS
jgi:hypothetical protein